MFTEDTISETMSSPLFVSDVRLVREISAKSRVGQSELFADAAMHRLEYFVEAVLASAPNWTNGMSSTICKSAAEIAETLAGTLESEQEHSKNLRMRSALLYELSFYPAIAQAILKTNDLPGFLTDWFSRMGNFSGLAKTDSKMSEVELSAPNLAEAAIGEDIISLGNYVQGRTENASTQSTSRFEELAKSISFGMSATEMKAFRRVLEIRRHAATRAWVEDSLFRSLSGIGFPAELWPSQRDAVVGGLLDEKIGSWGLASPTGTGKTFIARMLILNTLRLHPGTKVVYIVPSRALVYEVSSKFAELFEPLGFDVAAVTPQLAALEDEEASRVAESSVLVLTPEKADMLLRLGDEVFEQVSLVIIDEAHHIESSTRGILLEMYMWRLKYLLQGRTRFVFLSAVAPNIGDIAAWMGKTSKAVVVSNRPTRMRAGVYKIVADGTRVKGAIEYTDGTLLTVVPSSVETTDGMQLVQLAHSLGVAGPVLVVVNGKRTCEKFAKLMMQWVIRHGQNVPLAEASEEILGRLDSRLERELYAEVPMREMVGHGVAYHHAGLPPRVRTALEDAIRRNRVGFVFATTTLAEGVNFPFATVIVQSLVTREMDFTAGRPARYSPMTPRSFWNIAGRAGRPGFDKEGQVILFEPSLGIEKTQFVISDYLNSELNASTPVTSALSEAIKELSAAVDRGEMSLEDVSSPKLSKDVPKRIQGAVNLIRVSLLHARASKLPASPEDIVEGSFANRFLNNEVRVFSRALFKTQDDIVSAFLETEDGITEKLAAELGLSIQTLIELRDWARGLEDWRIRKFESLFYGGVLNLTQVPYVVGPIAKRMSELEGGALGGIYSDVIVRWLSGVPFVAMKGDLDKIRAKRIEDLVSVIFSRVQYLLPWGLYAADRLVEQEAKRRFINYDNPLVTLAYLADAGVPSLDAMRLVHSDFERTDAARLAAEYRRQGGLNLGLEILGWMGSQSFDFLKGVIAGPDGRRLDFDFERKWEEIRKTVN